MTDKEFWQNKYNTMDNYRVVGRSGDTIEQYANKTNQIKHGFDNLIVNPNGCVLDFGCGIGRFREYLEKKFDDYIGVDIVKKILRGYQTPGDFFTPSRSIEAAFSCVVMQHITDDKKLAGIIEKISNRLLDNGSFYLFEKIGNGDTIFRGSYPYIKKRTIKQYQKLFNGYKLDKHFINYDVGNGNPHAFMRFTHDKR